MPLEILPNTIAKISQTLYNNIAGFQSQLFANDGADKMVN